MRPLRMAALGAVALAGWLAWTGIPLPLPLPPTRPTSSPLSTCSDTPNTTCTSP